MTFCVTEKEIRNSQYIEVNWSEDVGVVVEIYGLWRPPRSVISEHFSQEMDKMKRRLLQGTETERARTYLAPFRIPVTFSARSLDQFRLRRPIRYVVDLEKWRLISNPSIVTVAVLCCGGAWRHCDMAHDIRLTKFCTVLTLKSILLCLIYQIY